jgi:hypothetical protein
MTGGLIQIASYGIHDIFLTGNPQITFFKTVYRRHSNFAMEYIEEHLNGTQNFGGYLSCNLSKAGDLLHKIYIKINIPQVAIDRIQFGIDKFEFGINSLQQTTYIPYLDLKKNYDSIQVFINNINFNMIQPLYKLLNVKNLRYTEIISRYRIIFSKINYNGKINLIKNIRIKFNKTFIIPLSILSENVIYFNEQIDISSLIDFDKLFTLNIKSTNLNIISDMKSFLDKYQQQLQIIKMNMNDMLIFYEKINNIILRKNINFAWVEYLGHQIINRVEVEIGGKIIDFTDSVRMNINYQLTNKILHDLTISKLIGNVPGLTTYDSTIKPPHILYIPLDFWFSKYSGLSLPLIYLRYHDVKINIKINDLVNCCYYERLKTDTTIEEIIRLKSVSLIVNYIYLDSDERRKFAQLSHEYLIDQTQIVSLTEVKTEKINIELPFLNPVKQLFWIVRDINNIKRLKYFEYSSSYYIDIYEISNVYEIENVSIQLTNKMIKIITVDDLLSNSISINDIITITNSIFYNGIYKVLKTEAECLYIVFDEYIKEDYKYNYDVYLNNGTKMYSKSINYTGNSQAFIRKEINSNPVKLSTLQLNGIQRFYKFDDIYTNFVQPYQHNNKAPNYGLNSYSFALQPEEYQPSGFCNFNKIDSKTMILEFNKNFINENINKELDIVIYAHNYNILRLAYGKAGIILNI